MEPESSAPQTVAAHTLKWATVGARAEAVSLPRDRKTALGDARLREKYELVRTMRLNECQEALARECELSRIILEYKRSVKDLERSRSFEREVHARESFYLIKENECLKEQVRVLEKMLFDARSHHDAELLQLRANFSDVEVRLFEERRRTQAEGAEQERAIQRLCSSLYASLKAEESWVELSAELDTTRQSLRAMASRCLAVQGECALWHEVLRLREMLLLSEMESRVELQRDEMRERSRCSQRDEKLHCMILLGDVEVAMNFLQFEVEMYHKVKSLLFEIATISVERETLFARSPAKTQRLSTLGEQHEAISPQLAQYMRKLEEDQRSSLDQVAWLKTLDDATLSYILHQRDSEISVRLRDWKESLLEAHKLLRELLKRYEPFQRGDEVFVARVVECLASAPHVKEPVNVLLS